MNFFSNRRRTYKKLDEDKYGNEERKQFCETRMKTASMCLSILALVISTSALSASSVLQSTGKIYFVATNGDNSNAGTQSSPFRTIRKGVSILAPSDTLHIRGGTYTEGLNSNFDTIPSGTSWANAVTISAYNGEIVTMKPSGGGSVIVLNNGHKYIIFDGITIDAMSVTNFGIALSNGVTFIRVQNGVVKNAPLTGVMTTHTANRVHDHEFINLEVFNNGTTRLDHGFYIAGDDTLIEDCLIHDNAGYGVHVYNGGGGSQSADRNIVRRNKIYNNNLSLGGSFGVIIGSGDANIVYNNIIWGNQNGIQVNLQGASNSKVYNNTVYGNDSRGIFIGGQSKDAIIKNNIVFNNPIAIEDNGVNTILSKNLTTDPLFADASTADFSIVAGSPAIDVGVTLVEVSSDFDGVLRPQGSGYDIGAYEYVSSGPSGPQAILAPTNLRIVP